MAQQVGTAALLLIGNELLSGKVHEQNLVELARTLRALGIKLSRAVVVLDDVETIAREIRALKAEHDVVFTSGGVGPTHDDVTIEAVARAFDVSVSMHPTMEKLLRDAYKEKTTEGHLRMALVPEGAELVTTSEVPWPTVVMKDVWVLPGVPEIFRMKLSVVRAWMKGPLPFVSKAVFTRLEEAALKPLIDTVVAAHPDVEVGSYPKWFDDTYKTKVTFDARDDAAVERAVERFVSELPAEHLARIE
ncbi:MAG: competence/damage-inducible protein A [Myxococcales bacterium]|nr:competence/damage-inducible protein A [Myxococcales bacterium]MCB9578829.1 competence/damage-inducible protein A [Polyangiaceae bacterium]